MSAKRYALFNLVSRDRPALRKVSAHGLGHLLPPYGEHEAPQSIPAPTIPLQDLECERWQHDLWYRIILAALGPTPLQVRLDDLPRFHQPAQSRYTASSPALLRWFNAHNRSREDRHQVRPFGFLLAYQSRQTVGSRRVRPVSPYDSDQVRASALCFDRETGEPISPDELLTYAEALAQYHPHPESKFLNGDYLDSGVTQRRHILATGNEVIGKEADRWEEQYYTGPNVDAEIEYGSSHDDAERRRTHVVEACAHCSLRELALRAGMSHTHVWRLVTGPAEGSPRAWARLQRAVASLKAESAQPSPVTTDDS